ncbi:YbaB/EbfC family nucleoid-associated protein [Amycolatopsis taiwanensis]|uniref:YbaB/EbfC family nucleoid-associated protein n=1 Tax=Amycolatopsis taiwanensis TaxID=342230 RepID=UPI00047FEFF4|nr:YbaB/EbfC family nucleoid-associated protein [Amycolatopsis taiwanensis]
MSAHMDQLIAQFENFQAKVRQAEARFAGVADMQERIAQVETSVTSPDGNVTVVAGAGGAVTNLRLAPGAVRLGSDRLAELIMTTMRQAVARAVQQQAGIVDDAFGDAFGINTSEQVRQAQAEAFGTVGQEPASQQQAPQQAPRPGRRPSPGDDDDYFDQDSILRG